MSRHNPTLINSALIKMTNAGMNSMGRWLVRHVDLNVSAGEIVTIIGPNGSGKSSTLKMLTGICSPNEGKVETIANLKIAYVPQSLTVDYTMPLSVTHLLRIGAQTNIAQIDPMLEKFGISKLAHQQVRTLSGGELQRVLLARALLQNPELLVLDEPAQGIDYSGQTEIYDIIREFRDKSGAGVVLVSHDLHLVMAASDHVICINGHICCSGTPQSIGKDPQYLKILGPQAAKTLAVYHHDHDHEHLPDGRVRHRDGTITSDCHPGDGHHD